MPLLVRALALVAVIATAADAQQRPVAVETDAPAGDSLTAGAPVLLAGDTLFRLYGRIGPFTPSERAAALERRLTELVRNPTLDATEISVEQDGTIFHVTAGDLILLSVTPADADAAGRPIDQLALDYATEIDVALTREIQAFSTSSLLLGIAYTALATIALILLLRLLGRAFPRVYRFLSGPLARRSTLTVQGHEIVSARRVARLAVGAAKLTRVALTLLLLYLYLPLVFSFFPWTRRLSGEIIGWVTGPVRQVVAGMLDYLPSLFFILVILAVAYYGTKLIKQFFLAVEDGTFHFEGFYPSGPDRRTSSCDCS